MNASANDFVVFIKEEAVVIQAKWLEELVRTCRQDQVAGVSPRQITPGDGLIQNAGNVLGLKGIVGSPYQGKAKLGDPGYLDCLQVARDVSTLPVACMMIRKAAYLAAGGMDETVLGDYFAEADLCHKLRKNKQRLIYQPLATIVYGGSAELTIVGDIDQKTRLEMTEFQAARTFMERWGSKATVDPYWNQNLSLASSTHTLETSYRPQWQYLPSSAPRILARPLTNGQGVFRITSPLRALRKVGLASECVWPQEGPREPSIAELLRLTPDTIVVQHYIHDRFLAALQSWQTSPNRPFVVYALDDLLTDMAESNPFRKNVPANSRARLKYALERCDRMVASTEFLAETYRHLIPDIKVVPNRLEQEIWLPLQSRKRTANKPRIGWAGGATHQSDLMLLKEIIEQTRDEADWIFFGMCPDEIQPLLAEFHPFADFSEYPARLAALNLDIAVAPLAQIPFNQGKSNLRLLEYGVLGIPVVCTDIDPYRGSPTCCVDNTASAWVKALRERIHDADAREQEGANLRQWVHNGYLLENHLEEWLLAHLPERK
jgi:glycosyltransferase involved in cell wall biosynthesis